MQLPRLLLGTADICLMAHAIFPGLPTLVVGVNARSVAHVQHSGELTLVFYSSTNIHTYFSVIAASGCIQP